jgi:membrane-bound lytic murein transglycosylase D
MPGTAREHGLTVTDVLDERLDPELGCAAGLEYLRRQYERYGDWSLALAAYNCGPGNVNKALRRSGGSKKDYWSIRKYLPRETRNYLPNIIAAAYLMAFHHEHDVTPAPMELDLQITEAITVYRRLSLHRVIQVTGLRPEVVLELNAQYLRGYLPGMPGGHRLRLPKRVMPAMRRYLSLHPENQPETAALLPWTSPRLHEGEADPDRYYSQYRSTVNKVDTTLRQVAAGYDLPVDQLAVWSNRGEFDSLSVNDEVFFFGISEYLPYDPRDRNTPPAPPLVEMLPTAPVKVPNRKQSNWAPEINTVVPVKEEKKTGWLKWFK